VTSACDAAGALSKEPGGTAGCAWSAGRSAGGERTVEPVLTELGAGLAAVRLAGALPRLMGAPRGDGHTVVDIPGWRAPELSGAPMRAYLRALGYDARSWGFGTNTGDPRRDVERLRRRVLEQVDDGGSTVSLVGWSLGGVIAREVARRHRRASTVSRRTPSTWRSPPPTSAWGSTQTCGR
jgi:pimeloyl-ACP methyl ester carboxylesterase